MRVAIVSRELAPFAGGGIATYVLSLARLLARIAEVTVLSTSSHLAAHRELAGAGDPRLPPAGAVRFAFVEEPSEEEAGGFYDVVHCYGARVLERLKELYPDAPPDLIEFADYQGEGFVTLQAAHTLERFLASTCVCVRLHTTKEIVDVLNGHRPRERRMQVRYELERGCLRRADRLLWAGGEVLATYQRFYGAGALAPALRVRHPFDGAAADPRQDRDHAVGAPLRLLYSGRLERRKGVLNLIDALGSLSREDVRLTLLGADTPTGPLGASVRAMLELQIAQDPRIELRGAVERGRVAEEIRAHDLLVVPSLWECWPYAALEALALNRPLLATAAGGLAELAQPDAGGFPVRSAEPAEIAAALTALLERPEAIARLIRDGSPAALAARLCEERGILDCYERLAGLRPRARRPVLQGAVGARRPPGGLPLVSAVVPYHRASRFVRETVESLLGQTYARLEVVLVNDGSFEERDWVLGELAGRVSLVVLSEQNRGLGAARNFGIAQSAGRYVLPFDADNRAHPEFVERCVAVLERRPELAYVTSWSRYIDETGVPLPGPGLGYQPLGNDSALVAHENVAGDAAALIPRRIFERGFGYSEELASYEDWQLYHELHRAGRHGAVIPERLFDYRVHSASMQAQVAQRRRQRLEGEMRARVRENEIRWTSSSA